VGLAAMLRIGLDEMRRHWKLALATSLLMAISALATFVLVGYRAGLAHAFADLGRPYLIVQEENSMGEFLGSRMPMEVGQRLLAIGLSQVVPEVHTLVGTSSENAMMLRGVDLGQYRETESFSMIAGNPLTVGSLPRSAMIGSLLAERFQVGPGQSLRIRGRDFTIVGVFETRTYIDNEAWTSLEDAQDLLGWGSDVSVFVVPEEGRLHEGDALPGGIAVARRGESGRQLSAHLSPLVDLFAVIARALGVASALALGNVLWRLAWIRRRELAILRSVGFQDWALVWYLLVQAAVITALGVAFGTLGTLALGPALHIAGAGLTMKPEFDVPTIAIGLTAVGAVMLGGTILPALWVGQMNLARLLRVE
jgi:putative ABC transport system permease protein